MDISDREENEARCADRDMPHNEEQGDCGKYPPLEAGPSYKYNFTTRLFILLSIVIGSTSLLINIMTYSGVLWSFVVVGTILFLWVTVAYPILLKRNIGHIIIVDSICASVYMFIIEIVTQTRGWGLTYVTPFLLIGSTVIITSIILMKRLKWREYAIYQTVMVILGFLPIIFCISGLVSVAWPSIVSAFYSFLTFTGMYIFAHKKYENELKKRFHV